MAAILAENGDLSPTDVATAAILGDPFAAELLARSGRLIGTTIAALSNAFNPSLIVLGGPWAQHSDILLAAIREEVYRRSLKAMGLAEGGPMPPQQKELVDRMYRSMVLGEPGGSSNTPSR